MFEQWFGSRRKITRKLCAYLLHVHQKFTMLCALIRWIFVFIELVAISYGIWYCSRNFPMKFHFVENETNEKKQPARMMRQELVFLYRSGLFFNNIFLMQAFGWKLCRLYATHYDFSLEKWQRAKYRCKRNCRWFLVRFFFFIIPIKKCPFKRKCVVHAVESLVHGWSVLLKNRNQVNILCTQTIIMTITIAHFCVCVCVFVWKRKKSQFLREWFSIWSVILVHWPKWKRIAN